MNICAINSAINNLSYQKNPAHKIVKEAINNGTKSTYFKNNEPVFSVLERNNRKLFIDPKGKTLKYVLKNSNGNKINYTKDGINLIQQFNNKGLPIK